MAKRLDQVVVIDLECTCWEGSPPPGEEGEIIEIGVCTLDTNTLERIDKESILVRPERSKVSEFCTRLTSLTQEQVETGISLREACRHLREAYRTTERAWASYGDFDRRQFERQCRQMEIEYPFGATHLNVKHLAALGLNQAYEIGLDKALPLVGISMEGRHHRGVDDAWNIAALLAVLLKRMRAK